MASPKLKLTYFNIAGRAEPIRLSFAINGVEFEDVRVEFKDWAALKPKTPLGQLPILELESGEVLVESQAILRYAAQQGKGLLYPKDALEAARVDSMMGVLDGIDQAIPRGQRDAGGDAEKLEQLRKDFVAGALKHKLEYVAAQAKDGYLCNGKLSIADFQFHVLYAMCDSGFWDHIPGSAFSDHAALKAVIDNVEKHPDVVAWHAKNGAHKKDEE